MGKLFTIGYAGKPIEAFIELLTYHKINCLIDVRSTPFSGTFPEYNSHNLKKKLTMPNIVYLNFKNEFGAKRSEPGAYQKKFDLLGDVIEQVTFEKVWEQKSFLDGVERVKDGVNKGFNIAFMCSEKNPIDCHRSLMVGEYFYTLGYDVGNIVDEGISYSQEIIHEDAIDLYKSEKDKFLRIHENAFETNLFGEKTMYTYEKEWLSFFKDNTISIKKKAMILRNLDIGYKVGGDEND